MAYENQNRQPRKKHALDENKLRLVGEKPEGLTFDRGRPPMLAFTLIGNNPRINVFTNVENDTNNGLISAKLDAPTFFAIMDAIEQIIDKENGTRCKITNKTAKNEKDENGRWKKNVVVDSHIIIGKDKEGSVYISVISNDDSRPKLKFYFRSSFYHQWVHSDNTPYTKAELSQQYARAYVRMMQGLMPAVMESNYEEWKPQGNQGGNRGGSGGGYRNNTGGGNSGGSSKATSGDPFGDDLEF